MNLTNIANQRYIQKVRIEGFQSYEDIEIELHPGINLLVGSSDAGKSAILRAINFALHNEPRGDDFVRIGCDEARVSLWWSDGCYFCRIKGTNRNAVLIRDKNGFETGFDRIGNSLPAEALAVLGNPPIDDEIGPLAYTDQHHPLFLVSLSASELPRAISRLTGIDDFEDAAEALNKKVNASNRIIKDCTKRIENFNEQLKKYDDLDDQLQKLDNMDELSKQIDDMSKNTLAAKNLLQKYNELMHSGRTANASLKQAEKITVLADNLAPIKELVVLISNAKHLEKDYKSLLDLEKEASNALQISERISDTKMVHGLNEIKGAVEQVAKAKEFYDKYEVFIANGGSINNKLTEWTQILNEKQKEKQALIVEMRDSGLWCNVCQRPKSMDVCNEEK